MTTRYLYLENEHSEKEYNIKLSRQSGSSESVTMKSIKLETEKAIQRNNRKFDETDVANLQKVIDLRQVATIHYESREINYLGHKHWLKFLLHKDISFVWRPGPER